MDNQNLARIVIRPAPPTNADNVLQPRNFIHVPIGTADIAPHLPTEVFGLLEGSAAVKLSVTGWQCTAPAGYDSSKQAVFPFMGTLGPLPAGVTNNSQLTPELYVENRHTTPAAWRTRFGEWLDRGLTALPIHKDHGKGNLIKWRILSSEYGKGLTFNMYKNGQKLNDTPIEARQNFIDPQGQPGDTYTLETVQTGETSETTAWVSNYLEVPMQKPAPREVEGVHIEYYANDCSVADANGDGRYEVLVKWYPSKAQDPGLRPQITGETMYDLYTLEGQLLWRIALGHNLTSSAHHNQMNFFDLDGTGTAKLAIKTGVGTRVYRPRPDGTIDDITDTPVQVLHSQGTAVDAPPLWKPGTTNSAYPVFTGGFTNTLTGQPNPGPLGRVVHGPEYYTVFDGATGLPLDTVPYFAPYNRRTEEEWGDNECNRSDRYAAVLAYMPKGGTADAIPYPTMLEMRGYYVPHFTGAYQFIDGKITRIWEFDFQAEGLYGNGKHPAYGNHQMAVADVDFDGYDELIMGSMVFDQDGTILWCADGQNGLPRQGHGDAMHVSVMQQGTRDFYIMHPHEHRPPDNVTVMNGATGELLLTYSADTKDVGRGVAANVTPLPGFEVWANSGMPMYNIVTGEKITAEQMPVNFFVYWTGDLLREFLDGSNGEPLTISKLHYDVNTKAVSHKHILTMDGTLSNNGTKANPCLTADIFGDWREEVMVRTADSTALRIYSTDIPTDYVLYTLMHDPVYRLAVNWQNNVYNQPGHLGFYLGEDIKNDVLAMKLPVPNLVYTKNN